MVDTKHTLVLTRCWEFQLVDGLCASARNRSTGEQVPFHEACGGRVLGSARLDRDSGRWQVSTILRLGERLAVEGSRGAYQSAPILAIEHCSAAEGTRRLERVSARPPAPPRPHGVPSTLRALWSRLIPSTAGAGHAGALA